MKRELRKELIEVEKAINILEETLEQRKVLETDLEELKMREKELIEELIKYEEY